MSRKPLLAATVVVVWALALSQAWGIINRPDSSQAIAAQVIAAQVQPTTTTTLPATTTTAQVQLAPPVVIERAEPSYDDFDQLIAQAPKCWEDEVVVLVIWDPYGDLDENNTVGCVPADNLPTTGYRP